MRSSSRLIGMLAALSAALPSVFTKGATPPKLELVKPTARRSTKDKPPVVKLAHAFHSYHVRNRHALTDYVTERNQRRLAHNAAKHFA